MVPDDPGVGVGDDRTVAEDNAVGIHTGAEGDGCDLTAASAPCPAG
jgi:hypothetical protein